MDINKKIQIMESLQASMLKRLESLERLAQPVAVIEIPNIGLPGTSIVSLSDKSIQASLNDHLARIRVLEGLALAEHLECHELTDLETQSRIRILEAQVEVLSTFTSRAKKIEELKAEINSLKNNGK